ncbi:MAG: hypothetical protein KGI25_07730 [Thaumarchaeota archaeon]|nr:hypothetical protein [Nitrososphaerota archaeon]
MGWVDNVIESYPRRRKNMPCRNDFPEPSAEEIRCSYEKLFLHDSTLAEIFCQTMQEIEQVSEGLARSGRINFTLMDRMPSRARKWWNEHKERDRQRIEAEMAAARKEASREAALAKLTPYERKLLGL